MTIRDFSVLKQESRHALDRCSGQKQLALVYAGGLVGLSVLLTLLDLLLSGMISDQGGLSNLGTRTLLSTLQTMLPIVQMLALLGWNAGYAVAVLKMIRGNYADHRTLASGFSLFFPMLRAMLLEGILYFNLTVVCFLLSVQIYSLTPWAKEVMEILEPVLPAMLEDPTHLVLEDAVLLPALRNMIPMVLIFGVLYLTVSVPISYRLRFSTFCLVDAPRAGALRAMATSNRLMRKNGFRLFLTDLRLWWYHGILALASLIQMLPMLGFQLPQGADVTYYVCYGAYLAIVFGLYALVRNRVEGIYAAAYDSLLEKPVEHSVVLGNIFDMQ